MAESATPNTPNKSKLATSVVHQADTDKLSTKTIWCDLCSSPTELRASVTLTTGQSFNWREVTVASPPSPSKVTTTTAWGSLTAMMWLGTISSRVVLVRETPATTFVRLLNPSPDYNQIEFVSFMRAYFQLEIPLEPLYTKWTADAPTLFNDEILRRLPGVRVLAQDPWETLLCFITSSNNNIPRIHLLMETLRAKHGELLLTIPTKNESEESTEVKIYSYPTLEALAQVTEGEFREMGFGYRAKFFTGSCKLLSSADSPLDTVTLLPKTSESESTPPTLIAISEALQKLPGVGRKVADCVALFAVGGKDAVPVDTHVWQMAVRFHPALLDEVTSPKKKKPKIEEKEEEEISSPKKKPKPKKEKVNITDKLYKRVGEVFRNAFPGGYAGWAHSVLFVAELPSFKQKQEEGLSPTSTPLKKKKREREN